VANAANRIVSPRKNASMPRPLISILILFIAAIPISVKGGVFDRVRDRVREDSSEDRYFTTTEKYPDEEDDDSFLSGLIVSFLGFDDDDCDQDCADADDDEEEGRKQGFSPVISAISLPYTAPAWLVGDHYIDDAYFPDFPYDDIPGHLVIETPTVAQLRGWSGRFTGQYGDNFDGVSTIGGRLQLDTQSRLGLDTEWNYRTEEIAGDELDQLWTGDANFVIRFAQSEFAEFHSGFGLNWLVDQYDTDFGFNFTYGADFFPVKPWVISSTMDLGTLGDATLFHFRGTAGFLVDGVEVFGGYDVFKIEEIKIDSVIVGVRWWF